MCLELAHVEHKDLAETMPEGKCARLEGDRQPIYKHVTLSRNLNTLPSFGGIFSRGYSQTWIFSLRMSLHRGLACTLMWLFSLLHGTDHEWWLKITFWGIPAEYHLLGSPYCSPRVRRQALQPSHGPFPGPCLKALLKGWGKDASLQIPPSTVLPAAVANV